jgi:hypothetical protein
MSVDTGMDSHTNGPPNSSCHPPMIHRSQSRLSPGLNLSHTSHVLGYDREVLASAYLLASYVPQKQYRAPIYGEEVESP